MCVLFREWPFGQTGCSYHGFQGMISVLASISFMAAIAWDRYHQYCTSEYCYTTLKCIASTKCKPSPFTVWKISPICLCILLQQQKTTKTLVQTFHTFCEKILWQKNIVTKNYCEKSITNANTKIQYKIQMSFFTKTLGNISVRGPGQKLFWSTTVTMCCVVWILSIFWAALPLTGWGVYDFEPMRVGCTLDYTTGDR